MLNLTSKEDNSILIIILYIINLLNMDNFFLLSNLNLFYIGHEFWKLLLSISLDKGFQIDFEMTEIFNFFTENN